MAPWVKQEALACPRRPPAPSELELDVFITNNVIDNQRSFVDSEDENEDEVKRECEGAGTMHIYHVTGIGRLQHGRASIHHSPLMVVLLLCCYSCYRCRRLLVSATRIRVRVLSFFTWPHRGCLTADAGFSLLFLEVIIFNDLSCV